MTVGWHVTRTGNPNLMKKKMIRFVHGGNMKRLASCNREKKFRTLKKTWFRVWWSWKTAMETEYWEMRIKYIWVMVIQKLSTVWTTRSDIRTSTWISISMEKPAEREEPVIMRAGHVWTMVSMFLLMPWKLLIAITWQPQIRHLSEVEADGGITMWNLSITFVVEALH